MAWTARKAEQTREANAASMGDPSWRRPPLMAVSVPPLPDGSVDIRALCARWDAIVNEGLDQ